MQNVKSDPLSILFPMFVPGRKSALEREGLKKVFQLSLRLPPIGWTAFIKLESPEGGMVAEMRRGGIRFCKKNPGVELLSHTLLCSTIVVRPLIDRVRDGNVSFKPAIDTGKKYGIKRVREAVEWNYWL